MLRDYCIFFLMDQKSALLKIYQVLSPVGSAKFVICSFAEAGSYNQFGFATDTVQWGPVADESTGEISMCWNFSNFLCTPNHFCAFPVCAHCASLPLN